MNTESNIQDDFLMTTDRRGSSVDSSKFLNSQAEFFIDKMLDR
jgi:hypothetical protein